MLSNFYKTFYLLLLISLSYIATDIYLPSLPAIAVYFNASEGDVQKTLFSYLLSFSFAPLLFGPLSDYIGRKKVILGGITISMIATFFCFFVEAGISWIIFLRFIQGLGLGGVMIASRASASDLFIGKALATQISMMTALMPIVLSLAPTIGGALQEYSGWQSVFVFLFCYLCLVLLLSLSRPESLKVSSHKQISQIFSAYRSHLSNRLFLKVTINFLLPSIGLFAYLTSSSFLFQEVIGLSPVEYGSLSLYVGATIMLTGFLNLKLIKHFPFLSILSLGSSIILMSGCLLLFFHLMDILNTWTLMIPILMYFTCLPLCVSNAASRGMGLIKENFGAASALMTSLQFLTGALTSYIFSLISDDSVLPLAVCFVLVGGLSLLNLRSLAKKEEIALT